MKLPTMRGALRQELAHLRLAFTREQALHTATMRERDNLLDQLIELQEKYRTLVGMASKTEEAQK